MKESKYTESQQKEIAELMKKMKEESEKIEKEQEGKPQKFFCNDVNKPYLELQERYGKRLKEIYDSVK